MNRTKPDTQALLKGQIEVWTRCWLWVPADAITFKPALCGTIYGDGRALFYLTTLNSRPAYYVIRGDSKWCIDSEPSAPDDAPDFRDFVDQMIEALLDEYGDARSYEDEECAETIAQQCADIDRRRAAWPAVDDEGGCCWGRERWPTGFPTVPHPWAWRADLLREDFQP
jgi:hypothetical protein